MQLATACFTKQVYQTSLLNKFIWVEDRKVLPFCSSVPDINLRFDETGWTQMSSYIPHIYVDVMAYSCLTLHAGLINPFQKTGVVYYTWHHIGDAESSSNL